MNNYEINTETIAIIPIDSNKTKVIEKDNSFIVEMNSMKIIERSCEYFGSSYDGRHSGTKEMIGISHKSPIIIEESRNVIYFPSTSPRLAECSWFALHQIVDYKKSNNKSIVLLSNGENIEVNMSYGSFDNQYLRATKLESTLRKRKM